MKKTVLFLFFVLTFISMKAQVIDMDKVEISMRNIEGVNVAYTPSFPLYEGSNVIGHFHLAYMYQLGIPTFSVDIEDDGGEFYQRMKTLATNLENDFQEELRAKQNNYYSIVHHPNFTIFSNDSFTLSPRLGSSLDYSVIYKSWDNDTESMNICISISCKVYVDTQTYRKELKESYLLKNDIYYFEIEYGDEKIKIPLDLDGLRTSKLISRFKKLLK
jgi:hypothetical protein